MKKLARSTQSINTLNSLFGHCVEKFGDQVALRDGYQSLTYRELNTAAARLAAVLFESGAAPGDYVGLLINRSADFIIAILAILRTGAAYMPLDNTYPSRRISFMLQDSKATTLIVAGETNSIPDDFKGNVIDMLDQTREYNGKKIHYSEPVVDGDDPAYLMYTSGSTGNPKGVVIPHRGVVRLVCNTDYIPFHNRLVVLFLSSVSFDASTFEIWGPLLNGGVCVVHPSDPPLLDQLGRTLRDNHVNTLWLTAALFNTVIDEDSKVLECLDYLLIGGEALSVQHVRKALSLLPKTRIINGYGPTENTTFTCCYSIPKVLPETTQSIPIGRPINGTYVRILDQNGNPVPAGRVGEIHIGGTGLAKGYLQQPELTHAAFIPDEESLDSEAVLYRSGDLGRWLQDGSLEFIGRKDHQLKIRGFRIEPGEIESKMRDLIEVSAAAVVPKVSESGRKSLSAYVVPSNDPRISPKVIVQRLSKDLPWYMIPEYLEIVDELPLLPSGKIDRLSLTKKPVQPQVRSEKHSHDSTINLITKIWSEILGLEDLAPSDNLIHYGADSLNVILFVGRLAQKGWHLDYCRFRPNPTVAGIARNVVPIEENLNKPTPILKPGKPPGLKVPLTSMQRDLLFLDSLQPGNPAYRFQAAIHFNGDIDGRILKKALSIIIARHGILRTTFHKKGSDIWQTVHPPEKIDLPMVDFSESKSRMSLYLELIQQVQMTPISLSSLPLYRHNIIKLEERHHVLLYDEHHIIHDGVSFMSVLGELAEVLQAENQGKAPSLPEIQWQYDDFARHGYPGAARERKLEEFWSNTLFKAPRHSTFPPDRPCTQTKSFEGRRIDAYIDECLTEKLKRTARFSSVTLFTLMFSAYLLLLHRLSGRSDIVVGTGSANRENPLVTNTLGMFVNTLPIRSVIKGTTSFRSFCRSIASTLDDAIQHQELPTNHILRAAGLHTEGGETPLLDTIFSFHDSSIPNQQIPGVSVQVEYLHNHSAKFDSNVIVIPDISNYYGITDSQKRGMLLLWEYSTILYEPDTMEQIVNSYKSVLQQVSEDLDQSVFSIHVLGAPYRLAQIRSATSKTVVGSLWRFIRQILSKSIGRLRELRESPHMRNKPLEQQRLSYAPAVQIISGIWKDQLKVDEVNDDDDFFELGGDSLDGVAFCSRLQKRTGILLPPQSLFTQPTPSNLALALLNKPVSEADTILRSGRNGPYLFLFHGDYVGGGYYASSLADYLYSDLNIILLNPYGQIGRPLPKSIESMADSFADTIQSYDIKGPYWMAGHCNGALVAYETARILQLRGETVSALFLFDPSTPSLSIPSVNETMRNTWKRLMTLNSPEKTDAMPPDQRKKLITRMYRRICKEYVLKTYTGITVLVIATESKASENQSDQTFSKRVPNMETIVVPGNHRTMVTDHAAGIARILNVRIMSCDSSL